MDKKVTGIVAYLTIIGWVIALVAGDKEGAKFHINQSLVLMLAGLIAGVFDIIPFIGGIISGILGFIIFVATVYAFVYACMDQEKEVPLLGSIVIFK